MQAKTFTKLLTLFLLCKNKPFFSKERFAIKGLNEVGKVIKGSKVLIMGLTYMENVPDTRESPVSDMVKEALSFSFSTGFLFMKKKKCVDVRGMFDGEERKGFYYKSL